MLFGLLALVCPSLYAAPGPQQIGEAPPELSADQWYHWVGDGPTLKSLEGRTVLVHFFVCKEPKKSAWLGLLSFYNDHAAKGLQIIAVTRDSAASVERFLEDYPLPFPVGAGSEMQDTWGASGDYGQVILDTKGVIFFRTDASNGTWNGKLLKALKGSKRPDTTATLRMVPAEEYGKAMKSTLKLLAEGKLAKALGSLDKLIDGGTTSAELRAEAEQLKSATADHIQLLMKQCEKALGQREVILARDAMAALAKDLKRHTLGNPARNKLSELEEDESFMMELEAAEQYGHLVEAFFRRGWKKNLARFEALVEEFPQTRAAQKMTNFWIKRGW
ncbi:MAG: hypothetical protein ACI9F9_000785 [Candidatus Paceibacteria bacterium]|jgi:hypothetical protein